MLDQRVLRVVEYQLQEGGVSAGRGKTIHAIHLDHFQVLLAIITARSEVK